MPAARQEYLGRSVAERKSPDEHLRRRLISELELEVAAGLETKLIYNPRAQGRCQSRVEAGDTHIVGAVSPHVPQHERSLNARLASRVQVVVREREGVLGVQVPVDFAQNEILSQLAR